MFYFIFSLQSFYINDKFVSENQQKPKNFISTFRPTKEGVWKDTLQRLGLIAYWHNKH